jgi:hypothetical protein
MLTTRTGPDYRWASRDVGILWRLTMDAKVVEVGLCRADLKKSSLCVR